MNQKKLLSEFPWIEDEIKGLRLESPRKEAVDLAAYAVNTAGTRSKKSPNYTRAGAFALAASVVCGLVLMRPSKAYAADLERIAQAVGAEKTRHCLDFRPTKDGGLKQYREEWISGDRFAEATVPAGSFNSGFDGKNGFFCREHVCTLDNDLAGPPRENLADLLNIPTAHVVEVQRGLEVNGKLVDYYRIDYSNVSMRFLILPDSKLPVQRDVFTLEGSMIEREYYDYPATIPDRVFQLPKGRGFQVWNYPSLRQKFDNALSQPIETKHLGESFVALRAVLVGENKVVAYWTGGGDGMGGSLHLESETLKTTARPTCGLAQTEPCSTFQPIKGLKAEEIQVLGTLPPAGPVAIKIPVWDGSRKLVGNLTFHVANPIYAPDPDRVIQRPGATN